MLTKRSSTGTAVVASPPDCDIQPVNAKSAQVAELVAVQMALEKYADWKLQLTLPLHLESRCSVGYSNFALGPICTYHYVFAKI